MSEEFNLGKSNLTKLYRSQSLDTHDSDLFDRVLSPELPYVTVDKERGFLLRFFNIPKARVLTSRKQDIIQIPYNRRGQTFFEKRTIIEAVNENTVVVDRPFEDLDLLPEFIFDFKESLMEGAKDADYMTVAERQQHLKSFSLEIIHQNLVFCKRCNFAMHYQVGDTLVFVRLVLKSEGTSVEDVYSQDHENDRRQPP